jgi:hypothetical protein
MTKNPRIIMKKSFKKLSRAIAEIIPRRFSEASTYGSVIRRK